MIVEFDVITDIFSVPDKKGNQKIIKKNVVYKKQFDSFQTTCEQHISLKGTISKTNSIITCNGIAYRVKHSYEYCKNKLNPVIVKGFGYANS